MQRRGQHTIISGGQVGVDEGALRGAVAAGVATSGYMPKGFMRAGGPDPDFAAKYGLSETTLGKGGDADRDLQNVLACDLLVAFLLDKPLTGRGTRNTMKFAYMGKRNVKACPDHIFEHHTTPTLVHGVAGKDILVVWDLSESNWESTAATLKAILPAYTKVMFSGPMERTSPGITDLVELLVVKVFS
ncbi:molybdenum cofactor carrier [Medusavirus stheno T3]|uniref:Molybdenum cofactor carrier n=1 Tax=Medusavirus stheno T3 TaxID=3069717 RepID=A0A7S8BDN3_9VIRU|nr:molybdenum cofactor carrier [Acanthamoeba castellanii medusavirus]QPB44374.1 molybdenum cofactor carrier [Medusavirus stheno T3]